MRVYAITNIFRSISSLPGPILVGLVFTLKLLYLPFLISGTLKLGYDSCVVGYDDYYLNGLIVFRFIMKASP